VTPEDPVPTLVWVAVAVTGAVWWMCARWYRLEETTKAVDGIRDKIDQQNTQLCDFESEIGMLKRRIESLSYDRDKDKKRVAQLQDALNRARIVSMPTYTAALYMYNHIISYHRKLARAPLDRCSLLSSALQNAVKMK